jgi:hypothetical protein
MIVAALVTTALGCFALAALAPAAKQAKPPLIEPLPVANYVKGQGVGFAIGVHYAKRVTVTFGARHHKAQRVSQLGQHKKVKFFWQASFYPGPRKKCYHIVVTAQNSHGTVTRKRKACRLGVQSEDVR